ncbi:unnamed protein product, partial [Brassica rapa]
LNRGLNFVRENPKTLLVSLPPTSDIQTSVLTGLRAATNSTKGLRLRHIQVYPPLLLILSV